VFGGAQTKGGSSRRGAWVVLCVLSLSMVTPRANAQEATLQTGGMDLHLFRPAVDTRGYFAVNGSEVMPHKEFSFGLVLDAGFGILRYNGFINNPNGSAADVLSRLRSPDARSRGKLPRWVEHLSLQLGGGRLAVARRWRSVDPREGTPSEPR